MHWFNCHCPERKKPVAERNWVVVQRNARCSAFDGYRVKSSDFSAVQCRSCRATGRTNAAYVDQLKSGPMI